MAGDSMVSAITVPTTTNMNTTSATSNLYNNAAVDTAVDTYASLVLRIYSPPESNIDSSLGPYVCSILRNATSNTIQEQESYYRYLEEVPEADSILELLEEHCGMGVDEAKNALWIIVTSVQTGIVDENFVKSGVGVGKNRMFSSFDTTADTTISHEDFEFEMINSISQMIDEVVIDDDINYGVNDYPSPSQSDDSRQHHQSVGDYLKEETCYNIASNAGHKVVSASLKPSTLIPTDLLAVMDGDVSTTLTGNYGVGPSTLNVEHYATTTPTATTSNGASTIDYEQKQPKDINSKPVTAQDLAASLFRPSRSRSNSMPNERSRSNSMPNESTSQALSTSEQQPILSASYQTYQPLSTMHQNQINSVVEILLSMNSTLSEEAALAATTFANYDVNLAQYVIEAALNAPPLCRHMLNDGCYRSDCQFSHDVDGNTCLFWLRGRCGKTVHSCRFLHGFSKKHLQGVNLESSSETYTASNNISTKNLVQHNKKLVCKPTYEHEWKPEAFDASSPYSLYSKADQHNNISAELSIYSPNKNAPQSQTSSFASVASKGYKDFTSFASPKENSSSTLGSSLSSILSESPNKSKSFARIPQSLWNPNYNRNSALFHIADPIERFNEVSSSNKNNRPDVIDLHFQSIKTFPIVLNAILPERLINCNDGVWIITGSGHHVNRASHQKSGGILEKAVQAWLDETGYNFLQGKDRNGYSGAVLVKSFHPR